ncbi:hypothetical protein C2G38_2200175 [Gigaspora rosea]|uniref:Uncharacterized protein n=1 Tax=Gigaspora rosea TaxID=44941 RepID=A0A397USP2_9GLOM|nr:hypothetical protein C2G38_2200175 [Gigaspora rosea]
MQKLASYYNSHAKQELPYYSIDKTSNEVYEILMNENLDVDKNFIEITEDSLNDKNDENEIFNKENKLLISNVLNLNKFCSDLDELEFSMDEVYNDEENYSEETFGTTIVMRIVTTRREDKPEIKDSAVALSKVKEKYDLALFEFIKALEFESNETFNAYGNYILGLCSGIGVKKNERKMFINFYKAAKMCFAKGIFSVGECYFKGVGIEKDEKKAFEYLKKSAEMGYD